MNQEQEAEIKEQIEVVGILQSRLATRQKSGKPGCA